MCLRAVRELPLKSIDRIFVESGHSEMEVESVHSAVEFTGPIDYFQLVAMAGTRDQ